MKEIITHNEHETEAFGRELATLISAPAVLCLYGELGAGKTALVRGLAEGMGLNCTVSSPTFTIVNEYLGERELIHFDMYRLNGAEELFDGRMSCLTSAGRTTSDGMPCWLSSGARMWKTHSTEAKSGSGLKSCRTPNAGSRWREEAYADTRV